jgi:hypothetical protein
MMAALDWEDPVNAPEPEPGFLLGRGRGRGLVHGLDSSDHGHETGPPAPS